MERSFGMLTQCWGGEGVFWRPFWFAFDRWMLTVMAMAKLHNLCIDQNVTHEDIREDNIILLNPWNRMA